MPLSKALYSSDGTLLSAHVSDDGQWRFEPADSVPEKFAQCIITSEDKRFRFHHGVDFIALARALVMNVRSGHVTSGASTITMQVIRMSRPDSPRTYLEKLYEMALADRLEWVSSKRKILLMYASNAPFGGNVVGIEAAAWRYFGCSADDLSWAESATLAVLPNAPGLIHPGRNRDALKRRRDALLDKLAEAGKIDAQECELAKDEALPGAPLPMPDHSPHLLQHAPSGRTPTTLDAALQHRVEAVAKSHFKVNHANGVDNMGILVTDVRTGDILAWYGNTRGLSLRGSEVDMVPARRSSGSTLKPLLYAAMLQEGSIWSQTIIKDTPYSHNDFSPQNYSRSFEGAVPASEVISRSLNVPSVRMLEQYGVPEFVEVLKRLGFSTVDRDADDYGLSLILGGAEITLYDLVRAYSRMAASLDGVDTYGDLRWTPSGSRSGLGELPFGQGAIWLAFEALSEANRPEEEASWMEFDSAGKVAWKTGTSWGNRDAWSVGVTPDYAVGVWVGNSDGEGRAGLTGVASAAPVMFDVFDALPPGGWFECPEYDLKYVDACPSSGLPVSGSCPSSVRILVPDVASCPDPCPYHVIVHTDPSGRWQVNSSCWPAGEIVSGSRFVLPPAMEWYYSRRHLDYRPLPPKHPDFDKGSAGSARLEIIYPHSGETVIRTRGLDGVSQGAVFKAAHSDLSAVLYWHLDGDYLGETVSDHSMMVKFAPGTHVLTVVDQSGESRRVRFEGR